MTKSVLQSIARLKRSLNTQIRSLSRAVEMCLITGLNWTVYFLGLKIKYWIEMLASVIAPTILVFCPIYSYQW